eukprot:TRINITY_DN2320_c0_g1_i1.p1 TRINITY_DN2320_c0_g1~~TRINITY_DN2320_c0_g1_i1.p1  ORF type:complete len:566 (-),score=122.94 TRINITY_DN2320_c0_g1_i1:199-1896(-)
MGNVCGSKAAKQDVDFDNLQQPNTQIPAIGTEVDFNRNGIWLRSVIKSVEFDQSEEKHLVEVESGKGVLTSVWFEDVLGIELCPAGAFTSDDQISQEKSLIRLPNGLDVELGKSYDVLDYFVIRGEKKSKWKVARVTKMGENKVEVHYEGGGARYDDWIDLKTDFRRLARKGTKCSTTPRLKSTRSMRQRHRSTENAIARPLSMSLSDGKSRLPYSVGDNIDVMRQGRWYPSSVEDINYMKKEFYVRYTGYSSKYCEWIKASSDRLAKAGEHTTTPHHSYCIGDYIDVKDFFRHKITGQRTSKWRVCQVISRSLYAVKVSYVGWSNRFDEWIDVELNGDRLSEMGKMSIAESNEEKNRREREEAFEKRLVENDYVLYKVDGDGNCLFRAVSMHVHGSEDQHAELRQQVCDHMQEHAERFRHLAPADQSFEEYITRMCQLGSWGDDPEIRALEEILDRPIVILSSEKEDLTPVKFHFAGDTPADWDSHPPIHVSYHGGSHYNCLFVGGQSKPIARLQSRKMLEHSLELQKVHLNRPMSMEAMEVASAMTNDNMESKNGSFKAESVK